MNLFSMNPARFSFLAIILGTAGPLLRADPTLNPKPNVEISYETRAKTPKVAGVPQLTPDGTPLPPDQIPSFYKTLAFDGKRESATAPYTPGGTNSQGIDQVRETIGGQVRYVYNATTDNIDVFNETAYRTGKVALARWGSDGPFPIEPVVTAIIVLSDPIHFGYGGPYASLNNPLGLGFVDSAHASDDLQLHYGIGGYNGVAAGEFKNEFKMALTAPEDPTAALNSAPKSRPFQTRPTLMAVPQFAEPAKAPACNGRFVRSRSATVCVRAVQGTTRSSSIFASVRLPTISMHRGR